MHDTTYLIMTIRHQELLAEAARARRLGPRRSRRRRRQERGGAVVPLPRRSASPSQDGEAA